MFLGYIELESTLNRHILTKAGNTPGDTDSAPSYRVYSSVAAPVLTGTCTGPVDGQTGWYKLSIEATGANGFGRGTYTVRVSYAISSTPYADFYSFTVV